jgi:hypothetical protein
MHRLPVRRHGSVLSIGEFSVGQESCYLRMVASGVEGYAVGHRIGAGDRGEDEVDRSLGGLRDPKEQDQPPAGAEP